MESRSSRDTTDDDDDEEEDDDDDDSRRNTSNTLVHKASERNELRERVAEKEAGEKERGRGRVQVEAKPGRNGFTISHESLVTE